MSTGRSQTRQTQARQMPGNLDGGSIGDKSLARARYSTEFAPGAYSTGWGLFRVVGSIKFRLEGWNNSIFKNTLTLGRLRGGGCHPTIFCLFKHFRNLFFYSLSCLVSAVYNML